MLNKYVKFEVNLQSKKALNKRAFLSLFQIGDRRKRSLKGIDNVNS